MQETHQVATVSTTAPTERTHRKVNRKGTTRNRRSSSRFKSDVPFSFWHLSSDSQLSPAYWLISLTFPTQRETLLAWNCTFASHMCPFSLHGLVREAAHEGDHMCDLQLKPTTWSVPCHGLCNTGGSSNPAVVGCVCLPGNNAMVSFALWREGVTYVKPVWSRMLSSVLSG